MARHSETNSHDCVPEIQLTLAPTLTHGSQAGKGLSRLWNPNSNPFNKSQVRVYYVLRSVLSEDYQDDRDLEPALSEPMSHGRDKHVSKEQQGGVTDDLSGRY